MSATIALLALLAGARDTPGIENLNSAELCVSVLSAETDRLRAAGRTTEATTLGATAMKMRVAVSAFAKEVFKIDAMSEMGRQGAADKRYAAQVADGTVTPDKVTQLVTVCTQAANSYTPKPN